MSWQNIAVIEAVLLLVVLLAALLAVFVLAVRLARRKKSPSVDPADRWWEQTQDFMTTFIAVLKEICATTSIGRSGRMDQQSVSTTARLAKSISNFLERLERANEVYLQGRFTPPIPPTGGLMEALERLIERQPSGGDLTNPELVAQWLRSFESPQPEDGAYAEIDS